MQELPLNKKYQILFYEPIDYEVINDRFQS